jgi:crotonobetainyl-CoA:carnitine CoA-transferase CaiB-like acyl-CoA transferase
MSGPLVGTKILDLSQVVAGPMCAMVLADQGAEVIKVEIKGGMDSGRVIGKQPRPDVFTEAATHTMMSRGKRSLVLDMKAVRGKELFMALVKRADVLIQNFRPGAMEKLGLSYEECRKVNPDLIYASLSGFGPVGPYADKPIYDPIIQGAAGVCVGQLDAEGGPALVQSLICDKATAITASQAITAALLAKAKGKGGQHVQVTMLNTMLQFQWPEQFYNHSYPSSETNDMPEFSSFYRLWKCADGKLITMIAVQDKEFFGACNALDLNEYSKDPRFASIMLRGPLLPEILGKMQEQLEKI